MKLADAAQAIADAVVPIVESEPVPLAEALGRVLATDLRSPVDVPAHASSAMDGYARRGPAPAGARFDMIGTALAGRPFDARPGPGECVRIMTGAVLPDGCDTVIAFEDATASEGGVVPTRTIAAGRHRRPAGEDLARGAVALARGRRLLPADVGLLASIGLATVHVMRQARVAVFSTGDELVDLERPLVRGSVRDSNRHVVIGMVRRAGAIPIDLGIVGDDPGALAATLRDALGPGVAADAIVTSGGVSAGDADHTRPVMEALGSIVFWKLAMKPGRPMAFGRVEHAGRSALLFGLPGSPVAVVVAFHTLVKGALGALVGARPALMLSITARSDTGLPKAPGRSEFVRAIARRERDGWHVIATEAQGSSALRSLCEANCLIVLEHDRGDVAAGETVEAWPFEGLM